MKVALDKDRIERVKNMQLYQAKAQVKYLSENDVKFLWEQCSEETKEETVINAIKEGLSFDLIKKLTGFNIERIKKIKEQLDKNNNG
jgi:thymidylate synthase